MAKEINEKDIIQYTGFNELVEADQAIVQKITTENFDKIKRALQTITQLRILIKEYKKQGPASKQIKYSVHIQVSSANQTMDVDKAQDYDLAKAMHKAFSDLRTLIEHRIHKEGSKKWIRE